MTSLCVRPAGSPTPLPAANRLNLDYAAEAQRLGRPALPAGASGIIDAHSHIHGREASRVYDRARRLFGVSLTYTMTQLPMCGEVREALGESVRFITIPTWSEPDRNRAHRDRYLRDIEAFATQFGSRMMKLWASPRLRDVVPDGAGDVADIDSPWRREHCKLAASLGMMYMVHVADPDTWFAAKYRDSGRYGTKAHQYLGLRRMLDAFPSPWIAAHMGGWPEDLNFLDRLLEAHPNLHLDTSATKWIARELSKHSRDEVVAFLFKHSGRILFGTDLVVVEDQLSPSKSGMSAMSDLASSPEQAFELYCSRHWVLRTMFESGYDGPSAIADPDLKMVEPEKYDEMATPALRGFGLPAELLAELYYGAADRLVNRWWAKHGGW